MKSFRLCHSILVEVYHHPVLSGGSPLEVRTASAKQRKCYQRWYHSSNNNSNTRLYRAEAGLGWWETNSLLSMSVETLFWSIRTIYWQTIWMAAESCGWCFCVFVNESREPCASGWGGDHGTREKGFARVSKRSISLSLSLFSVDHQIFLILFQFCGQSGCIQKRKLQFLFSQSYI